MQSVTGRAGMTEKMYVVHVFCRAFFCADKDEDEGEEGHETDQSTEQ